MTMLPKPGNRNIFLNLNYNYTGWFRASRT